MNSQDAEVKYKILVAHLECCQTILKELGQDHYWPARIADATVPALARAQEALEELK